MVTTPCQPEILTSSQFYIKILNYNKIIPLNGEREYIIGRSIGDHPIAPDIDLTPYNGYMGGVSRLHAIIKIEKEVATIIDLGSTNGTLRNKNRIQPHLPIALGHGDILSFGELEAEIQILNNVTANLTDTENTIRSKSVV